MSLLQYRSAHAEQFLPMFSALSVRQWRLLISEQKQSGVYTYQEMLTTFNNDPDLLKMVIIGDESWVYDYDIETIAN